MTEQDFQERVTENIHFVRPATVPISCYIRTLNEEHRIREVIRAAFRIADEVVIVDSGSKDKTLEIAQAEGAKVAYQPWLGWGRQKRVGEDLAVHDWVLDIDADEVITQELAEEIGAVFDLGPQYKMYKFPIVTSPPIGKPWWKFKRANRIKLYNKRHIRIPDHIAWDQFDVPAGERVGKLRYPLLHYSFSSIENMVAKWNSRSSAGARDESLKSYWIIVARVFFGFPIYFCKEYFIRGMIRGGTYGFACACAIAFGRWLRDVKMYERHMQAR